MPNEETKVEFKVCSIDYISLKNILNFPEIKESEVIKVRYEQGSIGVAPGSLTNVRYSSNLEDIKSILAILEIFTYEDITDNWQVSGGGYVKYSIYTNSEYYDIKIINGYISVNQKHYKFVNENIFLSSPYLKAYSFITYSDNYDVYTVGGTKIGTFEGLSEYEFVISDKYIIDVEDYGYFEAEFGIIYIHDARNFYMKNGNDYTFYTLVGDVSFDEIFNK